MMRPVSTVWLVTREYAGIAEAGGVKNVACSLAEGLARRNKAVSVFIPRYGCVTADSSFLFSGVISCAHEEYRVDFSQVRMHGVEIVFVESSLFREKHNVYVYTGEEARIIPGAIRGKGHFDVDIMNLLLEKAVLEYSVTTGIVPDVLHCQDAHTAILPALIRTDAELAPRFEHTTIAVTIHNAGPGYRQVIPGWERAASLTGLGESVLKKAMLHGNVEPFLLAAEYGILTTVSPWYADELTSGEYDQFTEGLSGEFERRGIHIAGITNGIDLEKYQPKDTAVSLLPYAFDPASGDLSGKYRCRAAFLKRIESLPASSGLTCYGHLETGPDAIYFSYHGRIAWQKGLDVLEKTANTVLAAVPHARFVILGQGDPVLEAMLEGLADKYSGRFVYLRGYERSLARMAVAVSDFLILPSKFEPCGLEDFIGQIFGTIPVAHAVGGLQKIIHEKSGFLYSSTQSGNEAGPLARLLLELCAPMDASVGEGCAAVPAYLDMIRHAALLVRDTYNWDTIIGRHYLPLYEKTVP